VVTLKRGFEANTPLKDALEFLDDQFELAPILIDTDSFKLAGAEQVADQPVQLPPLAGIRLGTVLQKLAEQVNAAYLIRADHIALVPLAAWQLEIWGRPNPEEEGSAKQRRRLPLVHADFDQRPLDDALRELAEATGYSIVLDARQSGDHARLPITALLNNLPLDTAASLLADQAGLEAVLIDNVLQVTTRERARSLRAEYERLNQNGIEFRRSFQAPGGM
jgi:hypothetical protein